jgi:hypothetical protein
MDIRRRPVGDTIGYGSNRMRVERVEREHALAWRSQDGNWVWTFILEPLDGSTRLVSRNRCHDLPHSPSSFGSEQEVQR